MREILWETTAWCTLPKNTNDLLALGTTVLARVNIWPLNIVTLLYLHVLITNLELLDFRLGIMELLFNVMNIDLSLINLLFKLLLYCHSSITTFVYST